MIENLKEWVPYNILIGEPENSDTHLVLVEEEWRPMIGGEGSYEVSSFGRVKSLERVVPHKSKGTYTVKEKLLKNHLNMTGYLENRVSINSKPKSIKNHRAVLGSFVENPESKPDVNHKDFNKTNNKLYNLEWSTTIENVQHAFNNKRQKSREGFNNANCRTTIEQVVKVKELLRDGKLGADIHRITGVSVDIISRIKCGKSYSNVIYNGN